MLGAIVTLGIAVGFAFDFSSGSSGLQHSVDVTWISGLGVDYSLGIDGLNLFLIILTTLLWVGGIAFAAFRPQERPQLFFFLMLLAERRRWARSWLRTCCSSSSSSTSCWSRSTSSSAPGAATARAAQRRPRRR